jgi:hypothetical protein
MEPFRDIDIRRYLKDIHYLIESEIEKCDEDYIIKIDTGEYYKYLIEKYTHKQLIVHWENQKIIKLGESYSSEVNRYRINISIPFDGNFSLFKVKPIKFSTGTLPKLRYNTNELWLGYNLRENPDEDIKITVQRDIEKIKKCVSWLNNDIRGFNESLESEITILIDKRKDQLNKFNTQIESLNIPVIKYDMIPESSSIPLEPKHIQISKPELSKSPNSKQYKIQTDSYEDILEICLSMSLAMERSPKIFQGFEEESIRDLFLIVLNSHYKGTATGETFNRGGKTDILIRHENKNIFITECKFWQGREGIIDAIDQLMNYLTWRDTKTAIFIFNKKIKISTILKKLDEIVRSHKCYRKRRKFAKSSLKKEGNYSYVFHREGDEDLEFLLTFMVFNIPQEKIPKEK